MTDHARKMAEVAARIARLEAETRAALHELPLPMPTHFSDGQKEAALHKLLWDAINALKQAGAI